MSCNLGIQKQSKQKSPRELLAFVALWAPYAALVQRFYFVTDDAFITFRYARNLVQGLGPRYNPGPGVPVDGCSSFLWMLLCSAVERLGWDIKLWPALVSFICGSVLLFLVFRTLLKNLNLPLWSAWLSAFFLGVLPPFFIWSTSGLETMAYALVMFAVFERLFLREAGPAPIQAGALGISLALIRSEGVYWVLVLAILFALFQRLSGRRVMRQALVFSGIALSGYLLWLLWHFGYYHTLFSSATRAKLIFSPITLGRGFDYLLTHHFAVPSLFLVIPGAVTALRGQRRPLGLAVAGMALGVVCFSLVVGGDHMAFARFLVPGLAFDAILFAWLITDLGRGRWIRKAAAGTVALASVAVGLLPAFDINPAPARVRAFRTSFAYRLQPGGVQSERSRWEFHKEKVELWEAVGRGLKAYAHPGDSLVAGAIGARGYFSGLYIYDRCGLVNRRVAELEPLKPRGPPGHQKCVGLSFFIDQEPDIAWAELFPDYLAPLIVTELDSSPYSGLYVAHFELVPEYRAPRPHYMVLFRKIKPSEDPYEAWSEVYKKLVNM